MLPGHAAQDYPPGRARLITVISLLVIGAVLLIATPAFGPLGAWRSDCFQLVIALVAVVLALIPAVQARIYALLERISTPSRPARRRTAIAIWLLAAVYLILSGLHQGRDFLPKYHDESMILLQARMLTSGRLWLPQHPLADFFEAFHIFTRPVYASMYFPGTALLYAAVLAIHVEPMLASAFICGAIVALMYLVVTEFTDGVGGLLAALLTLALPYLHYLSLMVMSHSVVVLLSLGMIYAYLRWREHRRWGWALILGICAGWALITRPLDALCFVAPVTIALLWDLRRQLPVALRTLASIAIGAAPFIALQLIMNHGITGSISETPVAFYYRTYWPGQALALHYTFDPHWRPLTHLAQFQDYYREFFFPQFETHAHQSLLQTIVSRWPLFCRAALPSRLTLLLIPLGVLGLMCRRRWVLLIMPALYLFSYAFFPTFLDHYAFVAAPAMVLWIILGTRAMQSAFPRRRATLAVVTTLALSAIALTCLTELNPFLQDISYRPRLLADVSIKLADLPHQPAVVLFRYTSDTDQSYHQEPVYNIDTPWPDDAPVIRAQDLGDQEDQKIFHYYAQQGPRRFFYRYDRQTYTLSELGWAQDLAK